MSNSVVCVVCVCMRACVYVCVLVLFSSVTVRSFWNFGLSDLYL